MNLSVEPVDGHNFEEADRFLAMQAAEKLNNVFPNYMWAVFVNSERLGGVMYIRELNLTPPDMAFVLKLSSVDQPDFKRVMLAGGEILERHGVK